MAPKNKCTKEDIVSAAFEIARSNGAEAITARNIGKVLGLSSRPIYTFFETMDELKGEVRARANDLFNEYRKKEIKSGKYPEYKASGMAYVRFARDERELFKLLFMSKTDKRETMEEVGQGDVMTALGNQTGLCGKTADYFHVEMWIFVHGVACMTVNESFSLDMDTVSEMVSDVYEGLKKRYNVE